MVMSRALSFMADPALAASVLPGPDGGFDIPAFLRDAGTVYMIAEAVSEEAPVAPLFAAMATEIHYVAAQIGQASEARRLDPPLLMGLDEVTQICPVPLPFWLSDSGGKGIQVIALVHGEAQPRACPPGGWSARARGAIGWISRECHRARAVAGGDWRVTVSAGRPDPARAAAGRHDPGAAGCASVSAPSSAETSAASAAPIRWKISSACRSLPAASSAWPAARAQRPSPASACASSQGLPIWRARSRACR